jgi:hypothetical protein
MQHSILAMEVCARMEPGSGMRRALRDVIAKAPQAMSFNQKWQQYQRAAGIVLEHLSLVERGCWDYFEEDAKARRDFDMWTNGMLTEEGVRPEPSGMPDPYRGEPRYLTFTMAFLLVQGSPTDRMMGHACNIPQQDLWRRDVFARILRALAHLSFASVAADVCYLIPRDDGWGLTQQDLMAPKFEYLRQLA